MPTTPVYALRYQALTDPPDGATLGEDLALDIEDELARVDATAALRFPIASIAAGTVSITPVANTPTSGNVSFGKTLPGTVVVMVTASSAVPGSGVVEVSTTTITSTGCTVWIYRTSTTASTINWIAVGLA
jgi:hypothetical protein